MTLVASSLASPTFIWWQESRCLNSLVARSNTNKLLQADKYAPSQLKRCFSRKVYRRLRARLRGCIYLHDNSAIPNSVTHQCEPPGKSPSLWLFTTMKTRSLLGSSNGSKKRPTSASTIAKHITEMCQRERNVQSILDLFSRWYERHRKVYKLLTGCYLYKLWDVRGYIWYIRHRMKNFFFEIS